MDKKNKYTIILVEDKNKMLKEASKLYISPNEIAQENSAFFGNNKVQAGQTLYIGVSGTDSKENSINYYDLLKEFDIELFDSSDNIVKKTKEIYEYNIRVNNDNKSLNISKLIFSQDIIEGSWNENEETNKLINDLVSAI